jgi:hypothetical protein
MFCHRQSPKTGPLVEFHYNPGSFKIPVLYQSRYKRFLLDARVSEAAKILCGVKNKVGISQNTEHD